MAARFDPEHNAQRFSRKRPLSPTRIDSREMVKRQLLRATEIITLDDDDDEVATEEPDHESAQIRSTTPVSFRDNLSQARSDTKHVHNRTPGPGIANLSMCQESSDVTMPTPPRVTHVGHNGVAAQKRTQISEPCQRGQPLTAGTINGSNWLDPTLLSHIEFTGEAGLDYALERLRILHTAVAEDGSSTFGDHKLTVTSTTDQLAQNQDQERAIRIIRSVRAQKAASALVTPRPLSPALINKSSLFSEDSVDVTHAELSAGDSGHRMHMSSTSNFYEIDGHRQAGSRQEYTYSGKRRQTRPHPHSSRGLREREKRRSQRTAIRGSHSVNRLPARSGGGGQHPVQEHIKQTGEQLPRFYAPLDSPPQRRRQQSSKDALKYWRTGTAPAGQISKGIESDGDEVDSDVEDRTDGLVPQDDSGQYSSDLRELLADTPSPASSCDNQDENWLSMFRPRGDLLEITLPKGFDDLEPERQQAILEHENEKERQRDLDSLKEAVTEWARNACTGDVRENELKDLQRYVIAVLDKNLSGKQQRSRVRTIKSNNRRRLERMPESVQPSEKQVQGVLKMVISPEQLEQLLKERKRSKAIVDDLQARRKGMRHAEKHRKKERRRQKYQERHRKQSERNTTCIVTPALPHELHPDRKAPGAKKKRLMQQLQEKLDEFKPPGCDSLPTPNPSPEHQYEISSEDEGGRTSDESEEEEGAEFFGIANVEGSSPATLEIIHHAAQDESDIMEADCPPNNIYSFPKTGLGRTKPDASNEYTQRQQLEQQIAYDKLLQENLQRQRMYQKQQSEETEAVEQAIEEETGCEASDSSDNDLDSLGQENHEDRIVIRYAVNACFRGFRERTDGDTYLIGHFHKLSAADQKLDDVISQAKQEYMNGTNEQRRLESSFRPSYDDDRGYLPRLVLTLEKGEAECAVWVEEEQHDLGEEAFQLAKTKRLFQKKPLWHVIWEKTEYYREAHADHWSTNEDTLVSEVPLPASSSVASPKIRHKPPYIEEVAEDEVQIFHEPAVDLFIECETTECDNTQSYGTGPVEEVSWSKSQPSNDGQSIDGRLFSDAVFLSSAPSTKTNHQSPASAPTLPTLVKHTAHQDMKAYTTIALANRVALARYLDWWYSTLTPELKSDHAWLRSEENFLEEEVRRHGDRYLWQSSKEEVVLGTEVIGEKHFEKLVMFWTGVRELDIYGPANTGYGE